MIVNKQMYMNIQWKSAIKIKEFIIFWSGNRFKRDFFPLTREKKAQSFKYLMQSG